MKIINECPWELSMRKVVPSFFVYCQQVVAADPLVSINEAMRDSENSGGGGGSLWMLVSCFVLFFLAIWLVASEHSPMRGWARENPFLANLFVFFFPPGLPILLSILFS